MNDPAFTDDLFLSHSSNDKPVVRELAAQFQPDDVREIESGCACVSWPLTAAQIPNFPFATLS